MSEYDELIKDGKRYRGDYDEIDNGDDQRLVERLTAALELEILNHESTKSCLDYAWRELHFRRNLFTIEEAADLVGLRPVTIEKLISEGELAYTFTSLRDTGTQHVDGTSLWEYDQRREVEKAEDI